MAQVRLIVEYDGRGFHGWQKQPLLRTVQSQLEETISVILRKPVGTLYAAGRTDSGVHARGQVVTFRVEEPPDLWRLSQGISHLLKGEVTVVRADMVDDNFHPGFSSTHKQYTYRVLNRPSPAVLDRHRLWHVSKALQIDRLQEWAMQLEGEHDFSSFRDSGCTNTTPVKMIYHSRVTQEGDVVVYTVIGNGFLKQMVRNIVGTLVDMSLGRLKVGSFSDLLDLRNRRLAGMTAPPHGLCLEWVSYEPVPAELLQRVGRLGG